MESSRRIFLSLDGRAGSAAVVPSIARRTAVAADEAAADIVVIDGGDELRPVGTLVAICTAQESAPRATRARLRLLAELQRQVVTGGISLASTRTP